MSNPDVPRPQKRQYPPIYEKFVPIALGVIALAILGLLLISLAVVLGWIPGGG